MEEEDKHSHLRPLIPFTPISTPITTQSLQNKHQHYDYNTHKNAKQFVSDNNIIIRILLLLLIAIISIWANYEASKTFHITIVNDAQDSTAGRRFALSYVSNDKATRIVQNTSSFVEHFLYPNNYRNNKINLKKHIDSVTLRLARRNLNATAIVYTAGNHRHGGGKSSNSYVIEISPMLLEDKEYNKMAIVGAVLRGMAHVWLWDGGSRAPPELVDGMVEYVAELAGFRREVVAIGGSELPECEGGLGWWWEDKDPRHVARLLYYCEKYKKGFIQRLNEALMDTWHDRVMDEVLGMPVMKLCGLHNASWVGSI
ncbi:hypothetical protein VNO77_42913 [Canavalia gladiata]|uniref:Uncharacterized protein n=1 Tax=Canavalia gladiata TaxID=3824 RepID=A0AAN9PMH4_CANGL